MSYNEQRYLHVLQRTEVFTCPTTNRGFYMTYNEQRFLHVLQRT